MNIVTQHIDHQWKGPLVDGVTQSLLNQFLECPYTFYLYTILGLTEREEPPLNLMWGDCYHKGLELLIPDKDFKAARAGMREYLYSRYPNAPKTFSYSLSKMLWLYSLTPFEGDWITEEVIDQHIQVGSHLVRIRGKKDGITRNHPQLGRVLAEHKAKGYIDPLLTQEELLVDVQCSLYLTCENKLNISGPPCEWIYYDLIKIPEAQKFGPARSRQETDKEYVTRLFNDPGIGSYKGNYPIYMNKSNWIHQGIYNFTLEAQERVWDQTISPSILRLIEWYNYVTQSNFDHEDPRFYNELFYKHPVRHFNGRKTEKFKCRYHSVLTDQTDLSSLVPVKSYFSELEEL